MNYYPHLQSYFDSQRIADAIDRQTEQIKLNVMTPEERTKYNEQKFIESEMRFKAQMQHRIWMDEWDKEYEAKKKAQRNWFQKLFSKES